jgi:hypothetical protein
MADGGNQPPPGQGAEAGRLAQKSDSAFRAAEASPDPAVKADRLEAAQEYAGDAALAAAYTYLQNAVGLIAVSLPFVLALGNLAFGADELQGSISGYYHTRMGDVFVGSLFALAVFFLSYNYRPLPGFNRDNMLSTFASVAAVGVALFPTASHADIASSGEKFVSIVHLIFAGALFTLLAVFSLFLFTKTGSGAVTAAKQRRNVLYRTCGGIIVGAMALVLVSNIVDPPSSWNTLFWLETIAVVAFGVSWLVKGGFLGILADEKRRGESAPESGPDRSSGSP